MAIFFVCNICCSGINRAFYFYACLGPLRVLAEEWKPLVGGHQSSKIDSIVSPCLRGRSWFWCGQ